MSMKAASCTASSIKKPIVIKSKETAKTTVPACNNVLFPNLCRIQIAIMAPIMTSALRKQGTIDLNYLLACEIISPPYATTALIPENCLKIIQCMAVKIATAGVAGYYI